jgi:hypothetical protein
VHYGGDLVYFTYSACIGSMSPLLILLHSSEGLTPSRKRYLSQVLPQDICSRSTMHMIVVA